MCIILYKFLLCEYTMNINYKLSLNEYQEAVNFHYKTGKRAILIAVFLGMATFILLVKTDFSNTQAVINNILFTFFILSFYLLFTRMLTAYQAKKTYLKNTTLSQEVTLHISGKGIKYTHLNHAKTIPWDNFTKWKKNDSYYMLYTNPHQFNIIPKRALQPKEIDTLEDYLHKYIY